MRFLISITFILTQITATFSQQDPHISQVENGLILRSITPVGQSTTFKNINDELRNRHVNGISIAIIDNYEIAWAKSYGVVDASTPDKVTNETLFQCASIGKMITAMAVLTLVRDNKITLDEDVNLKLVKWKVADNAFTSKEKVTLRRLLSHSAGFSDDYGFPGYEPTDRIPTLLQILNGEPPSNVKKKLAPATNPGSVERYSGGGYLIVQQMIEDVSGESFSDYVQTHIFAKIGMANTTYNHLPDVNLNKSVARGHHDNGKIDKSKRYHVYPEQAAAGPWTTATDLAKFVIEIQKAFGQRSTILSKALVTEMISPQINYKGLGTHLKGATRAEAFWHAGNNAGYIALLYGMIYSGQGAVVLTNSNAGENLALEIMSSVANSYEWPAMRSYQALPVNKEDIASYSGNYVSSAGKTVIIGENEKGLYLIPASPKKELPLYKIGENHFTLDDSADLIEVSFAKDELTIVQNFGKKDVLTKLK